MASYHCSVKVGGKGKASAHAAYISREGKYSGKARYEDLEATAYGNMPSWAAHNAAHFWLAADEHERANGATYREIEVALPRELDAAQRRALVEDFIAQEIGDKHAYQWAIHTPKAALEKGEQPHAHIMYSERTIDGIARDPEQYFKRYNGKAPERGGCRKDSAGTEERLQATRQRWADVQNSHLARHGQDARVDHRSLKEQGIARLVEKHIGASRIMDMDAQDVSALLSRRAAEGALAEAQQEVSNLIDLSGDLAAAMAERDASHLKIKQGIENERIRHAIFERIGENFTAASRSSAATERACRFTESDFSGIADNLSAANRFGQVTIEDAHRFNRAGRAVEEAARGQHARRTGGIVDAVGDAIGRIVPEIAGTLARVDIYIYIVEHGRAQRANALAAQERVAINVQAVAEQRARATAIAQVQAEQAAAAAKAQQAFHALARAAEVERKAAWVERGARRRSGTPNRIIRLDQSVQAGRIEYRWTGSGPSAGKIAVIQKGNKLSAAGRYSPPKAAAMAQIAQQNGWQSVTITGDAKFKAMVLPELLARGIIINNLELQPQVQAWQVKAQVDAELNLQAKAQADAERLSAQRPAEAVKRQVKHEHQQEKYPTEHAQRQAERQAAREQWQEKYEAERRLEEAIALIKQQAAAKELAGQAVQNSGAAVAPSAQAKQSTPLAWVVDVPAVVPAPARLDAKDVALFQGAEQAIAAGDMKALAGQLRKIDQVERKLIEAVTLAGWDAKPFDEEGASRQFSVRDFSGRREAINAAAKARGEKYIPFSVGHSRTLTSDTYDYQQEQAVHALSLHARSDRPESFFKKQAGRDWDAKKAELETTRAAWASAVAARDRAEQTATTADNATFQYRLDAIRKEHAAKAAAAIAKCTPIKERLQDFTAERKRIERATATLSQEKQKELGRERGRSHGISR